MKVDLSKLSLKELHKLADLLGETPVEQFDPTQPCPKCNGSNCGTTPYQQTELCRLRVENAALRKQLVYERSRVADVLKLNHQVASELSELKHQRNYDVRKG